jgi:hypothetical protein
MEPRMIDAPVQSRGEGQTSPPRQSERKRRFQIVKLEERIAPGHVGKDSVFTAGHGHTVCQKHCGTY